MTWDGKSVLVAANVDGLTFTLVYEVTDGKQTEQITEPYVSSVDSIDQIINDAVKYRNGVDAQKESISNLDPSLYADVPLSELQARKAPPPPTQYDLEKQAFLTAMTSYTNLDNAYQAAIAAKTPTTITPQNLSDSYSAWKTTFIHEEFGVLIPKDFHYL